MRIFNDKIKVYLARKIFSKPVKCCLEASKADKDCEYKDTLDHKLSYAVSNALDEVQDVCETLCMSGVLVGTSPKTQLWDKYFSQSGYIKYVIENWYINVIRLEDMLLVLVNELYELGIKKELLGYEIVVTNRNLPENVAINLKSLHKAIKPIRAARIMLIHHQTLYEERLHEIRRSEDMVKLLREAGGNEDLEESLKDIAWFNKKFKVPSYLRGKQKYMIDSNSNLLEYVAEMLELFEKRYTERQQELVAKRK